MCTEHFKCQALNFEVHFAPFPMKSSGKRTKNRLFLVISLFWQNSTYMQNISAFFRMNRNDFFLYSSHIWQKIVRWKKNTRKKTSVNGNVITMVAACLSNSLICEWFWWVEFWSWERIFEMSLASSCHSCEKKRSHKITLQKCHSTGHS